ncbi:MAG: type II secretion system F family protein [Halarcobacter sp.]
MKYKIIYQEDKIVKTKIIEANSFENISLPENTIEVKKEFFSLNLNSFSDSFKKKYIKEKELISLFYELSLMLDSKILLDEALEILIRNKKDKNVLEFLKTLQKSFSKSQDINKSLENFKINPLIKSYFKITQESGNISSNIKSLSTMINDNYEIKKEFKKAMTYPFILIITFFFSLIGIFKVVVPKFEFMFTNNKIQLPLATKILFITKDIFENYFVLLVFSSILIVFILIFIYKNSEKLRYKIDKTLAKNLFLISDLYKYKIFYTYFVILDILLKSKYEFHESLVKSRILLKNKYVLDKISQIENLLKSGKSVSSAFESTKLFDDITISLLNTGEITNSLDVTISEIKNIYKKRFDEKLKTFVLLIEPMFLVIIMALIVWIILAVFVPLWSMGDMLKV